MLSRAPLVLFLLSLAGLIAIVFQGGSASVRFESDLHNYVFVLVVLLLFPASILWGAYRIFGKARWTGLAILGGVFSLVLFFPVRFVTTNLVGIVETGHDSSFEKIHEQVINGHRYRLYRTSEGGSASHDLVLRGESDLFPGMKTVRTIKYAYAASNATLEALPSGMARLVIEPDGTGRSIENFEFQP